MLDRRQPRTVVGFDGKSVEIFGVRCNVGLDQERTFALDEGTVTWGRDTFGSDRAYEILPMDGRKKDARGPVTADAERMLQQFLVSQLVPIEMEGRGCGGNGLLFFVCQDAEELFVWDLASENLAQVPASMVSFGEDGTRHPVLGIQTAAGFLFVPKDFTEKGEASLQLLTFDQLSSLAFKPPDEWIDDTIRQDMSSCQFDSRCPDKRIVRYAFDTTIRNASRIVPRSRNTLLFQRMPMAHPLRYWVVAGWGPVPEALRAPEGVYREMTCAEDLGDYLGGVMWFVDNQLPVLIDEVSLVDWKNGRRSTQLILIFRENTGSRSAWTPKVLPAGNGCLAGAAVDWSDRCEGRWEYNSGQLGDST